jgi:hypothetical protein
MITVIISTAIIAFLFYKIFTEIRDNYENKQEDRFTKNLIQEIRIIDPKVNEIVDSLKFYDGKNRSYTLNKQLVHLCKVDKDGNMYDKNQLILVLIHEISHALCDEVGHTQKFNEIFEDLLDKAHKKGVYDPTIQSDPDYCTY